MNWRRGSDYYEEGDLPWLEVATIIHDQSHGAKSMKDFLRALYGGRNDGPQLNNPLAPVPPLGGLEISGWNYVLDGRDAVVGSPAPGRRGWSATAGPII